ncbi:hypothetical protein B0T11DRAFT_354195 [Plectosphaerella cucumerina]|uniref:Uncharacterized protein n=1 Tax=Plectosphaerella cucumerina TaxID=40658 RepID=A0A8K0X1S8_9PEZI|nr:hypothetical protein B0T11DRAFT_354195 [Plectosphaerella cucumerina]
MSSPPRTRPMTAQNKSDRLSDEVIHVVRGFQVAGFPHIVGCLWPPNDRNCLSGSDVETRPGTEGLVPVRSPWADSTCNNEHGGQTSSPVLEMNIESTGPCSSLSSPQISLACPSCHRHHHTIYLRRSNKHADQGKKIIKEDRTFALPSEIFSLSILGKPVEKTNNETASTCLSSKDVGLANG